MIPDPERAPLVTKLFKIAASGAYRQYELLGEANKLGLTSKRTGRPLTLDTLKSLLINPAYCGRLVSRAFGKEVRGDWEPLIDDATFSRVQAVLRGNVERIAPEPKRVEEYPLRGFVLCTECSKPATASTSKGGAGGQYAYYHCHRGKGHLRVSAGKVNADFLRLLESLAPRDGQAALMEAVFRRTWEPRNRGNVSDVDTLRNTLAGLMKSKERLMRHMEDGTLSDEDFRPRYQQLNAQIHTARERLAVVTRNSLDVETALGYLSHLLWNAHILWETSDLDTKQRLQRAIFPEGLKYDPEQRFGTVSTDFLQ
jgi:hypothetical protein